ncbi:MAG: M3 family metallopeptidase, partial [Chlorobiales bacterium]|nr:M3 family metallopeptidase [Chlorobiales bacterium]
SAILRLEKIGDRLHQVWSPVSHLHAVANSPELRNAYNECLPLLARYETELAQDEKLFRLYEQVAGNLPKDRTDGASSLLRLAIRDFHLAGVDLPDDKKQRFKAIMEELTQLQAKFEQNVLDSMASWSHHETSTEKIAGIPAIVLEKAEADARKASTSGWLFQLDQPTFTAIITHAANRDLRYQVYKAWVTRASDLAPGGPEFDNSENIERMLALRHEAAQLVGFENFAEYSLATKMAESVAQVRNFLENLAAQALPAAKRELEALEKFAGKALAAWDIAYYSEQLRQDRYSVSDEELRPYFPVDTVLTGLFALVGQIYDLRIHHVPDVDVWYPEVRFYRIENSAGVDLG